jgi:hypothetical protein
MAARKTSKKAAKKASKVLRGDQYSDTAKTPAGSALSQVEKGGGKKGGAKKASSKKGGAKKGGKK